MPSDALSLTLIDAGIQLKTHIFFLRLFGPFAVIDRAGVVTLPKPAIRYCLPSCTGMVKANSHS